MSAGRVTQLDHDAGTLSTAPSESERDNALRFFREPAARTGGHVESHFLKANSPDGVRALWIKHTLLAPVGRPEAAVAEVWAIAFADRGRRKCAEKRTFALAEASHTDAPFALRLPCAELGHGQASGTLGDGADALAWSLRFAPPLCGFRPFPFERMYSGGFPRSKSLTPAPDLRVHGSFQAFGERWAVEGWRGAQGHNWGRSHAHAYAWVHANAWQDEDDPPGSPTRKGVWFEALSGRVRLGAIVTPWLSVAGLALEGQLLRFDGLRALASRQVRVEARGSSARERGVVESRSYSFELVRAGARLRAEFCAEADQFAGLRYVDPDGRALACLNSKLARGRLTLSQGGRIRRFRSEQAALELGTRGDDHGVPILA